MNGCCTGGLTTWFEAVLASSLANVGQGLVGWPAGDPVPPGCGCGVSASPPGRHVHARARARGCAGSRCGCAPSPRRSPAHQPTPAPSPVGILTPPWLPFLPCRLSPAACRRCPPPRGSCWARTAAAAAAGPAVEAVEAGAGAEAGASSLGPDSQAASRERVHVYCVCVGRRVGGDKQILHVWGKAARARRCDVASWGGVRVCRNVATPQVTPSASKGRGW